ncbi:type VI secretion system ATPase TssH [Alcaligenes endophyticus]|uniref:Type VI secretion system ATPase TssH n=1 Tax=Alcaligenes endophyticus TaxID=1929088 RepID=A0ABT8EFP3_9BURK|nr:type VI secretion system ATPase TssH [Alcaligenes endophyticus]MCX5590234.1 type VI secretion system ATPase TssH [Alcaligenes endophyticus]MDN4120102.1 type VI secretion system ATPase TssH [Alcaligenes endophyticus]
MQIVEFKSLVERLNPSCRAALETAAGTCLNRTHYEICIEHLLVRLLDDARSDIQLILRQAEIDPGRLQRALEQSLESFKSGNGGRPQFSPLLPELFADAWLIASVELYEGSIRSGALLAAFVARTSFYASGTYATLLQNLDKNKVIALLGQVAAASTENADASRAASPNGVGQPVGSASASFTERFCEDFTAKARLGKIDPVFGRDAEIRQMVDILARRRKNNPICVGDPGVGKTAVIEGLALRIVEGDVPQILENVTLLGLDLGALEAGAGVKGEFENRLRGVINEIKASSTPIILFIDEAHTLIGAGGNSGTNDAANLLKPALARGELRTIAATTWGEYKKYFEKDAALARRFELVKLDEPSVDMAAQILRGLKPKYEEVHQVIIRDDALAMAAELSSRYISGRQLPDKAIDLLDTACARIKVNLSSKPDFIEDRERTIQMLEREKSGLLRDLENRVAINPNRVIEIDALIQQTQTELADLNAKFTAQLQAAQHILALRSERHAHTGDASSLEALNAKLIQAEQTFNQLQAHEKLIFIDVSPDTIAKVVSDRTGIPLGKMMRDQASQALNLEALLGERIKGQNHALGAIAESMKAASSGLHDPNQPMGIFLLVGPSGTGKTETALSLAELMFGGEQAIVSINMSEFQEKHTISRLVGSPPGYVGYGEGGLLTEAVRQKPYSVVLLDEVEKAHLDVVNLFYQVFDKGVLSDGEGREINFRNTVVFLTSNLALDVITELCAGDEPLPLEVIQSAIRPILSNHFKPALLARMTVVPFMTLKGEALKGIVQLKVQKLVKRMQQNSKIALTVSDAVIDAITDRCTEVDTGARNIDFILRGNVMPLLSNTLLSKMAEGASLSQATLDIDAAGQFTATFS